LLYSSGLPESELRQVLGRAARTVLALRLAAS